MRTVRRVATQHVSLWQVYLGVGFLGVYLYLAVPPFAGSGPYMNALGLTGMLAIIIGVRRNQPASRTPWWLFVVGLGLFWLGDIYTYSYPKLFHKEVPFPSIGDALYLMVYPALMAGLVILVRRRNPHRDRGGTIDSTIMTLGLAVPSWVVLIAPYVHDGAMDTVPKLVSIAYPLFDVLLLAATVRLAMDSGRRKPAFYLLSMSLVALLLTDFIYGVMTLNGTYSHQLSLDIGWVAFYLFWGAAALHPSMSELDEPSPDRATKLTPLRLALLAGASLIAPVIELVQEVRHGNLDLSVTIGASLVLFGFVVARMAGLVRQQERSVARERILSGAGASLVAAATREEMHQAALRSIGPLLGGPGSALICLRDERGLSVVARGIGEQHIDGDTLSGPTAGKLLELAALPPGSGDTALAAETLDELGLPATATRAISLGLLIRDEIRGVLVVARPVSTSYEVEAALRALATQLALALESAALTEQVHERRSEARFASLVQNSTDLITVVGPDATIRYQSPSVQRVLGYTPEELVGSRFDALVASGEHGRLLHLLADGPTYSGHDSEALECTLRHRDGTEREFEILYTNLLDDEHVQGVVLNARDISERKAFEEQLTHQAFHDAVTGLPNRALFVERVRHAIARATREAAGLAVIFLDLDDFKTINDSLGHGAGDRVLLEVAKRLSLSLRASDTPARFGGDEFALLLEDIGSVQEAADTAERITDALALPFSIDGKEVAVRASMGIAVVQAGSPAEADELIRDADAAMYIAKRDGKGGYQMFEPAMHEGVLARLELRADLQRALTAGEFELHYQPVVRLQDRSIAGVEALLRWNHPERGMVQPDQFIPFAEETGLIVPMGRWVLREACRQAVILQTQVPCDPQITMSVNLSVKQLQHADIVADVRDALAESGLDPALLTLEITETVLMTDTDLAIRQLEELRALGLRLAMDDFGTGYSSLSYLSRFPVDILKMDRSFLQAGVTPETSDLTRAVVALGETLSLEVVAEGIELDEQWTTLRELGCALGQGFYFARPMDASNTLEHLRDHIESPVRVADSRGGELPAADAT